MANAQYIIERALRISGVIGAGETPSANIATSCFNSVNDMLDSWNTESLFVYTVQDNVVSPFSSQTLTIGPTGTLAVTRPVKVEQGSFYRIGNDDYPLEVINQAQYASIADKSLVGPIPEFVYFDANGPDATAYFYPIPSGGDLHLKLARQLTEFADLTTDYFLPQGYRDALILSLAERLFEEFQRPPVQTIVKRAIGARMKIKRVNVRNSTLSIPVDLLPNRYSFDITTGA